MTPTTTATTATVEAASNTGRSYPDPEILTQKKRGPVGGAAFWVAHTQRGRAATRGLRNDWRNAPRSYPRRST
jgi:hypothetical protein